MKFDPAFYEYVGVTCSYLGNKNLLCRPKRTDLHLRLTRFSV